MKCGHHGAYAPVSSSSKTLLHSVAGRSRPASSWQQRQRPMTVARQLSQCLASRDAAAVGPASQRSTKDTHPGHPSRPWPWHASPSRWRPHSSLDQINSIPLSASLLLNVCIYCMNWTLRDAAYSCGVRPMRVWWAYHVLTACFLWTPELTRDNKWQQLQYKTQSPVIVMSPNAKLSLRLEQHTFPFVCQFVYYSAHKTTPHMHNCGGFGSLPSISNLLSSFFSLHPKHSPWWCYYYENIVIILQSSPLCPDPNTLLDDVTIMGKWDVSVLTPFQIIRRFTFLDTLLVLHI